MKIKNKIIEMLGGLSITEKELYKALVKREKEGEEKSVIKIHEYMISCNGLSADEWCKSVWLYVDRYYKILKSNE